MKNRKNIVFFMVALLLFCNFSWDLSAHELLDFDRHGSVCVRMEHEQTPVPGGTLTMYRVADVTSDDGNNVYKFTESFTECGLSLEELQSSQLVSELAEYALQNQIPSVAINPIDDNGMAVFSDLSLGLYLLIQSENAPGYYGVNPFLVSVPTSEGEVYIYDVDATPKLSVLKKQNSNAEIDSNPDNSNKDPIDSNITWDDSKLPQTGQLNWPIPIFTIVGLFLFLIGWKLRFTKRAGNHEK